MQAREDVDVNSTRSLGIQGQIKNLEGTSKEVSCDEIQLDVKGNSECFQAIAPHLDPDAEFPTTGRDIEERVVQYCWLESSRIPLLSIGKPEVSWYCWLESGGNPVGLVG